jgi:hypothetical protein
MLTACFFPLERTFWSFFFEALINPSGDRTASKTKA